MGRDDRGHAASVITVHPLCSGTFFATCQCGARRTLLSAEDVVAFYERHKRTEPKETAA